MTQHSSRNIRTWIQAGFLAASLLTGLHVHRFFISLQDPAYPPVPRPEEVDAWLPISSFTSLVYLLKTGIANTVHPAGLVLFSTTILLALIARRGFCSWVCPVGTISEWLHKLGAILFKRNPTIPRPLDITLQGIKYLLLLFFVVAIGSMSKEGLYQFIHGPYNRVCDLKMYILFASPSRTTIIVSTIFILLSIPFKNFWCRYFCPYGALLALTSIPAPLAIRRNPKTCTSCQLCTLSCPNRIKVADKITVRSPECTACLACVSACPEKETLRFGTTSPRYNLTPLLYGAIILLALLLVPHLFRTLGYWESDTPRHLYLRFAPKLSELAHP